MPLTLPYHRPPTFRWVVTTPRRLTPVSSGPYSVPETPSGPGDPRDERAPTVRRADRLPPLRRPARRGPSGGRMPGQGGDRRPAHRDRLLPGGECPATRGGRPAPGHHGQAPGPAHDS